MQSQQEEHNTTSNMESGISPQYSAIPNDYGWLTKLNFLVLACFGMAFLILDDEPRWISAVGLFFCFMLIFVLNALSKQQHMILFQQRQIQDLLQVQRLNTAKELNKEKSSDFLKAESKELERYEQNIHVQMLEQMESDHFDQVFTPNNGAEVLHDSVLSDQQNISTTSSLNPSNLADTNEEGSYVKDDFVKASEYIEDSQVRYAESQSQQAEHNAQSINQSDQSKESTLLKDLKGMTSLWSAFVEWFKGGNSIVRIAIIILLIGVILLLRFASEYWQPTLSTKLAGIAVAGGVLTAVGYWLRNKRYGYAISVQGAGLGILFLVLFSAFKLAVITSVAQSYGLLIGLLAVTLLLALKQNALILAFIALGSGFIAPFILNTGSNNIPALFSYYLVLNIALAVIAFFKPWRILNTISLLATFGVGGLSIWLKAQPEQYAMLSILVWLHFALYLFVSIRYSQNIAQYKIAFKNIPLIDTALIFATPFMAFTLYAGLVYHNQTALSVASAVLALVYFVVGYVLHKKSQTLTLLIQSFYGLGLTFLALILPFAFDAQWTSTGWAVQALALIWMGCRHHLKNSVLYGLVLLGASSAFWLKSILFDGNLSVLAVCFLTLAYLASAYIFSTPELNEKLINDDIGIDHIDTEDAVATPSVQQIQNSAFLSKMMQSATLGSLLILQFVVVLYCFMVDQNDVLVKNAELMAVLTLASIVIAVRVFQVQQLSKNMQLFAGCALFYFAMIPLVLWQTDIISIWWTLQALSMLIITCLYAVPSIRNASTVLLWASAICAISAIFGEQNLRYIVVVLLIIVSTFIAYWLWYKVKPASTQIDRTSACLNLSLSFIFVPYVLYKICDLMQCDLYSIALPMLLWWGILTLIYRFKHQVLDQIWLSLSIILLFIGVSEIAVLSAFIAKNFQFWTIEPVYQIPMLMTIALWFMVFIFCLKVFTKQMKLFLKQFFMLLAVLLMAVFGGLLASNQLAFIPMLLLLPVVVLLASLKVKPLQFLQPYWQANISIVLVGGLSVWLISLLQNGQWNLPYITLLNPMDALSIGIFVICIFAMKPLIQTQGRELQIANMAIMIVTGLMLISSVMLRSLHHYMNLPYWSVEAWQNGTVQASLTILWVVLALILTTFASKKSLRHVWMLGIAVLALVIAKLIFLDLSHTHTITRIVSFIGSGLVMLVIGYFAPLPPAQKIVNQLAEDGDESKDQPKN